MVGSIMPPPIYPAIQYLSKIVCKKRPPTATFARDWSDLSLQL
ncbi:hypothetical protein QE392_002674 [Microbacterium proteolyticum]|nr:hypothetical protein [Microbacterium sp. SORGH_AS_0344]MDQ1170870.1 hypothetical protein [Microbacterium proteolyticum]